MSQFPIVDLTKDSDEVLVDLAGRGPSVDPEKVREQLAQIRDGLSPLFAETEDHGHLALNEVEIKLALSIEGHVAFIAKGTAEASITLKFGHP